MSNPRSRANFVPQRSTGGGGGGPSITALLAVGPDFGEGEGNDDNTHTTGLDHEGVTNLALTNDATTGTALTLPSLGLTNDAAHSHALDLDHLDLTNDASLGSRFGQQTGVRAEENTLHVPYLHFSRGVSGDAYGFINLRQDQPSTTAAMSASATAYLPINSPYHLRPETVPGVSGDASVAYAKWPTSEFRTTTGDLRGVNAPGGFMPFAIQIAAAFTNPNPTLSATITCVLRVSDVNPWTGAPTWNSHEPILFGSQSTYTANLPAGVTNQILVFSPSSLSTVVTDGVNNKWLYAKFTSDLTAATPALAVTMNPAHASGNPSEYPPSPNADSRPPNISFNAPL